MRVLIVEDDMIIAGGLGPMVTEAGHELVGLAADRDTAVALLGSTKLDLVLIDLHLADGWTGLDVARAAAARGVTAIFTTANPGLLPDDLGGAFGLIEKPYRAGQLRAMLVSAEAMRRGDDPVDPQVAVVTLPRRRAATSPVGIA